MGDRLRYKGKFIKRKVLDKRMKIINSLQNKQEKTNNVEPVQSNLLEGVRVVDLKELGKNLKCSECNDILCLDDVVDEIRSGLHSTLKVKCKKCDAISLVSTGKFHRVNNNKKCIHSDSTTGVVLGAIQAGYGCSGLNKILACANIPTISTKMFKRYEREVGTEIERAAQDSCKRDAKEQRQLSNYNKMEKEALLNI